MKDDPEGHIAFMREIYDALPDKPRWLSKKDIDNYKTALLNIKNEKDNEQKEI